jgi:hypothetical protein
MSGWLVVGPVLNFLQSKQIQWQQQQVQAEHRQQPIERAISDECDIAEDRDDP